MTSSLNSLESKVLDMLLAGDHPVLAALRKQLPSLKVTSREMTGCGFFTDLAMPADSVAIPLDSSFVLSDVLGDLPKSQDPDGIGYGFVLFVTHGRMTTLEGYANGNHWPSDMNDLQLSYFEGPQVRDNFDPQVRDMDVVRKEIGRAKLK